MGKVDERGYRIVRLRRGTYDAVRAFGAQLKRAWEEGRGSVAPHDLHGMTIDALVGELLRREQAKMARSRQRRGRRTRGKAKTCTTGPEDGPGKDEAPPG